jgi:hypothetical protein
MATGRSRLLAGNAFGSNFTMINDSWTRSKGWDTLIRRLLLTQPQRLRSLSACFATKMQVFIRPKTLEGG